MRPDIRKRREKHQVYLNKRKDVPCADCGGRFPSVAMDFHHTDESKKDPGFNNMKTWKIQRIDEELEKCVVLCANCHRVRHLHTQL